MTASQTNFYIFLKPETPLSLVLGGIQTDNLLIFGQTTERGKRIVAFSLRQSFSILWSLVPIGFTAFLLVPPYQNKNGTSIYPVSIMKASCSDYFYVRAHVIHNRLKGCFRAYDRIFLNVHLFSSLKGLSHVHIQLSHGDCGLYSVMNKVRLQHSSTYCIQHLRLLHAKWSPYSMIRFAEVSPLNLHNIIVKMIATRFSLVDNMRDLGHMSFTEY